MEPAELGETFTARSWENICKEETAALARGNYNFEINLTIHYARVMLVT